MVIGIISDRLDQPDAAKAHPRWFSATVPQAEARMNCLKKKHMRLDAVIELRVNESALLQRVETRSRRCGRVARSAYRRHPGGADQAAGELPHTD